MPDIDTIVREINRDLVPEFERKLRADLVEQDKDWLIEHIVRLTLDAHSLEQMDRKHFRDENNRRRQERAERVQRLKLDNTKLHKFIERFRENRGNRDELIRGNLLSGDAPPKGKDLFTNEFRAPEGAALLQHAKDMLFGLLFGDESMNIRFHRTRCKLLTLTVPCTKSDALDFMRATTKLRARGNWQDPTGAVSDLRLDNTVLESEYGETDEEIIGHGVITALKLINNLEINEEILYGRLENIEPSTLVS